MVFIMLLTTAYKVFFTFEIVWLLIEDGMIYHTNLDMIR